MSTNSKLHVKLRIQHENCPYLDFSSALLNIPYQVLCRKRYDLLLFPGKIDEQLLSKFSNHFPETNHHLVIPDEAELSTYLIMDCYYSKKHHVGDIIEANYGVQLSPIRFYQGTETYEFLVLEKSHLGRIFRELDRYDFKVELEYVREGDFKYQERLRTGGLPTFELLKELTPTQLRILSLVYDQGYYEIPRNVTLEQIANSQEVSRQAIQKSLRKAENKIMELIVPMLNFEYCLQEEELSRWS